MKYTVNIKNEFDMIRLGELIARNAFSNMVILLEGDLGSGKTTLTKGIGLGLNVKEVINSPTFTILKIYEGRLRLFHMDVYRCSNSSGDTYLEEYFYSDGVCCIEWSSNISEIIPDKHLKIDISILDDGSRDVKICGNDTLYYKVIEGVKSESFNL